ncbi:unnamed protein product [Boreogadus saida]
MCGLSPALIAPQPQRVVPGEPSAESDLRRHAAPTGGQVSRGLSEGLAWGYSGRRRISGLQSHAPSSD